MTGRLVYGAAAFLLAVSLLGLGSATRAVHHYAVEIPGGIPAMVYEPGPPRQFPGAPRTGAPLPVVVLAHGYMGNTSMMSSLGRRLARAGYASVALAFRGHDRNPRPFSTGSSPVVSVEGVSEDLAAAVRFARSRPGFDAERIAVAGHSMGAFTSLEWASRDPAVDAVIAISGGAPPTGPYPPPNVLLVWASADPKLLRDGSRAAAASLAGLERVVLDRTYGDLARGSAVRASEVEGVDHLTILYSGELATRVVEWLGQTLGPGVDASGAEGDGRFGWTLLGFASALVMLWGLIRLLAPFVPAVENPPVESPLRALATLAGALVVGAVLLAGVDASAPGGPFGFLPLAVSAPVSGYQALCGVLLLLVLAHARALRAGLRDPRTWLCAGVLLLATYLLIGTFLEPYAWRWLTPQRALRVFVPFALMLPFFAAFEFLLRGARPWVPIVGRAVILAVMLLAAILRLLPFELFLVLGGFVVFFAFFELIAYRASRQAPNPWLMGIYQAGWSAIAQASLFPVMA